MKKSKLIASVCVDALPLGKSGILKNKNATTYHLGNGIRLISNILWALGPKLHFILLLAQLVLYFEMASLDFSYPPSCLSSYQIEIPYLKYEYLRHQLNNQAVYFAP